jgi:hypothetical protein
VRNVAGSTQVTVPLDQLGALGAELGRGGQASVFSLPHFTLDDAPGQLVYKRYHVTPRSSADLCTIVSLRNTLDPMTQKRLDAVAAWPCRVVMHAGTAVGVVMPRISKGYVDTLQLPSGKAKQSLREVLNLFAPIERVRRVGRPIPSDVQRLQVCRDFAAALSFLHEELGVVFGDINAKNELWQLSDSPFVMFLDCDAVRPRGSVAGTRQLNAPDWDPPEGGSLNRSTDLYKLGLFILRTLSPGDQASARRNSAAASRLLDRMGLDLLARAVGKVPGSRPSAREWTVYLSGILGDPLGPPSLGEVELDRTFALAGQPVEIKWKATDAVWVEILMPGQVSRVRGLSGAGTFSVILGETRLLTIRAGNEHGIDERELGLVTVVPQPEHRLLDVPMPRLDWDRSDLLRPPPQLSIPPLPALGHVAAPDPIGLVTTESDHRRYPPVDWPSMRSARFPLDLIGLITASPDLHMQFEELP